MTAPWESMLHAASEIVEAANQLEEDEPAGARCLGIHFEGPFLNPKFRRIHRNEWLLPADARARARRWSTRVKAPASCDDGAEDRRRRATRCASSSRTASSCSAGHTGARYREGMLAIGLGFRSLTHAFNGMPPLDHRDPSILAAFIQDRRTLVQLICDGIHVSPVMVDILHRTLGDRIVLATDNMPPADPGYHIEGGVMRAEDGTIAGSALRMDEALRNYMSYAQIPFAQAIVAATHAPARLIGHDGEMGRIARGARADLSFWDAGVPGHRDDGRRPPRLQPRRSRGVGKRYSLSTGTSDGAPLRKYRSEYFAGIGRERPRLRVKSKQSHDAPRARVGGAEAPKLRTYLDKAKCCRTRTACARRIRLRQRPSRAYGETTIIGTRKPSPPALSKNGGGTWS